MAMGIKYGGRQKGTPNKSTRMCRETVQKILDEYYHSGLLQEDFLALKPAERFAVVERLLQYVMPKMQATSVGVAIERKDSNIEDILRELAQEEGSRNANTH